MTPKALHETGKAYMKGWPNIPLTLGRLTHPRQRKLFTSTQLLSQCADMRGGTMQPINFSKPRWAGAHS